MSNDRTFWEEQEQVERFAAREPDHRLRALITEFRDPPAVRVLDVGCAAGRNTVFLAELGFDVWAVDSSSAMVARTRSRLAPILGSGEAERRVRQGFMDRLDWVASGSIDLVIALGIYHCAASRGEWERSISESVRTLKAGGRCLVSTFTPETDLTGQGVRRVEGEDHVYEGYPGGRRAYLVDPPALDLEMAGHGLEPVVPTETVRRIDGSSRRVSTNGLYVKRATAAAAPARGPDS